MSAVVIAFRPPGSPIPRDKPVVIPLKTAEPDRRSPEDVAPPWLHPAAPQPGRPKLPKAELARRTRILADVAAGYDLSITIHGQVGRV